MQQKTKSDTITMSFSLELFICFTLLSSFLLFNIVNAASPNVQTYIIQVQRPNAIAVNDYESWHRSFLPQSSSPDKLIHSYTEVFSGFSAKLTDQELKDMESKPGFIRSFPNKLIPLQTTHTPAFLNLTGPAGLWNTSSNLGQGTIIGVLDGGILPNHPSFSDKNMPPPPKKWKGTCGFQDKTSCNNKVIGARNFYDNQSDLSDSNGHGSHTSSTAAGNFVEDVDFFGLGSSTMSGMAPHAHLAIYKVCDVGNCTLNGILAAIDSAVKDGVDVLSLSIGAGSVPYDSDPIAIALFGAVKRGVIVVCATGNYGMGDLANDYPWVLSVAAGTVDRNFRSTVKLGNGKEYYGEALYQPSDYTSVPSPLVYDGFCHQGTNNKGKITACNGSASGSDFIMSTETLTDGTNDYSTNRGVIGINFQLVGYATILHPLSSPSSQVSPKDGVEIKNYIMSETDKKGTPTATITFDHTVLGVSPSRVIPFFSSRGPSHQAPNILKPDISAPGVNIIAAWNKIIEGSGTKFPINVDSGTSMAAPHASGVAAILKSVHPDWSPAMIKSAIMTSSYYEDSTNGRIVDSNHENASFFAAGAGYIDPKKAVKPGLVYDLGEDDYCGFLCGNLGNKRASTIGCSCSNVSVIKEWELNYPSIIIPLSSSGDLVVNRTVTNVDNVNAKYVVEVDVPKDVTIIVKPEVMQFQKPNEKQSFSVSVKTNKGFEGNLKWVSGDIVVRSPLIVTTN